MRIPSRRRLPGFANTTWPITLPTPRSAVAIWPHAHLTHLEQDDRRRRSDRRNGHSGMSVDSAPGTHGSPGWNQSQRKGACGVPHPSARSGRSRGHGRAAHDRRSRDQCGRPVYVRSGRARPRGDLVAMSLCGSVRTAGIRREGSGGRRAEGGGESRCPRHSGLLHRAGPGGCVGATLAGRFRGRRAAGLPLDGFQEPGHACIARKPAAADRAQGAGRSLVRQARNP